MFGLTLWRCERRPRLAELVERQRPRYAATSHGIHASPSDGWAHVVIAIAALEALVDTATHRHEELRCELAGSASSGSLFSKRPLRSAALATKRGLSIVEGLSDFRRPLGFRARERVRSGDNGICAKTIASILTASSWDVPSSKSENMIFARASCCKVLFITLIRNPPR